MLKIYSNLAALYEDAGMYRPVGGPDAPRDRDVAKRAAG